MATKRPLIRAGGTVGRGGPWLALSVVALSAASGAFAPWARALELDRAAFFDGQVWRIVTGQFVHWSSAMAVSDLGVLLAAAWWIETRDRRWLVVALSAGVLIVGTVLLASDPTLTRYRGSSGLANACVAFAALDLAIAAPTSKPRAIGALVLIGIAVKVALEFRTGAPLWSGTLPAEVRLVPAAHVAGAAAGCAAYLTCLRTLPRRSP